VLAAAVKEAKNESAAAHRFLILIRSYLMDLHRNCGKSTVDTMFYLDWDVLFEAIHAERPQSVFGGALWEAFESSNDPTSSSPDTKFLVPDGTLSEMIYFLQGLVAESNALRRQSERKTEQPKVTQGPIRYWSDAWNDVLPDIKINLHHKAVNRLSYLLTSFCAPNSPTNERKTPPDTIRNYYGQRLQDLRCEPDQTRNNNADSMNLAVVDAAQHSDEEHVYKLVTTTTAVRRANSDITVDPVYLYLDMYMRSRFPNIDRRRQELDLCIRDISSLIPDLEHLRCISETEEQTDKLRGDLARSVLASIRAVESNQRLADLLRSMSVVSQDIRNRFLQASSRYPNMFQQVITTDDFSMLPTLLDESIGTLRRKIARLLSGVMKGRDTKQTLDLHLEDVTLDNSVHRVTIRQRRNDRPVVVAEIKMDGAIACNWDTHESVYIFIKTVSSVLGHHSASLSVGCRINNELGIRMKPKPVHDIGTTISELSNGQVPSLIVIDAGTLRFWYHFIAGPTPHGWQRGDSNRIAVAVSEAEELHSFETIYDETAANWVSPAHLREMLSEYRGKVLKR
jgi:hypothetical protein